MYKSYARNCQPEWMDDPMLDPVILQHAVDDITKINTILGGFKFTCDALVKIIKTQPDKSWVVVDAGCGDGAMLRYLDTHILIENVSFIGIDLSAASIAKAIAKSSNYSRLSFLQKDILTLDAASFKCDILTSTLTLHHFTDVQLVPFLAKCKEITTTAMVINDLHRSRIAYLFFKLFSPIFIKHKISRHDGLISIAAAFKRIDFKRYARAIGVKNDQISWKWSFRYIWIIPTNER